MRHQSYEATLLSRGRLDPTQDAASGDLQEIVENQGLMLERIETVDGMFLLLDCGPVQVLIAFCNDPMPVLHFLNAGRPAVAMRDEGEILALLHGHRATTTVLVTDTPGSATPGDPRDDVRKRTLCADLTDWLFTRTAPDLVFWCDTDTLYAAPEFDRASTRAALGPDQPPAETEASRAPAHFQTDPPVWDKAQDWIETPEPPVASETPEDRQTPGELMVEAMLSVTLPTWAAINLAKLQDSLEPRAAIRQATRACTVCTLALIGASGPMGL